MAATILTRRCSHSFRFQFRTFATKPNHSSSSLKNSKLHKENNVFGAEDDDVFPTSGISRPISHILNELNKKVPDSLIRHIVNRIMNLHAPEWSGEVRSITYSADAKSVSVVYRVTLYGTDAEIFRESTGTTLVSDTGYGDAVQKAEAMAFRRACARFGLGLHLYHEDIE
ncbi:hypothetical protein RD792_000642 [Penstemon davidsonii]|uniref:Uncharacterized protein n=1 Tax=Penstemon davidsonii TaxID=160366 RepID=A0ABR0DME9_9LAMI|nr:hypothetical protein RD792_000642 [Penstemon davidsonii]